MKEVAAKYWNSQPIVHEFSNAAPPEYWVDYFTKIDNRETKSVLDLGCGGGRNTKMLASLGFKVTACDLHDQMIQATLRNVQEYSNVRTAKADMESLPFDDCSFDYLLANGIYHNVSSQESFIQAISESSRVLAPNAKLCVNMFCSDILRETLSLKSQSIYITPDGLDLLLLPSDHILELFAQYHLIPDTKTIYETRINNGLRCVLRCVLSKQINA